LSCLSLPQNSFAFINETDGSLGKVACAAARKIIRTHVIRTHWAHKTGSSDPEFDGLASKAHQPGKAKLLPVARGRREVLRKDTLAEAVSRSGSAPSQPRPSASDGQPGYAERPSHHLTRATDAAVYAGYYIDVKSYGFSNHYSSEYWYLLSPASTARAATNAVEKGSHHPLQPGSAFFT
jgi:hypothetical protein